jgi:hypothetical protein
MQHQQQLDSRSLRSKDSHESFRAAPKPRSAQEIRIRKKELLSELSNLQQVGYIINEKYTMSSAIEDMEGEIALAGRLFGERMMRENATNLFFFIFWVIEVSYVAFNPLNLKLQNLSQNLQSQKEGISYEISRIVKLCVGDAGTNPFISLAMIVVCTLFTTHMLNYFQDNPEEAGRAVGKFMNGMNSSSGTAGGSGGSGGGGFDIGSLMNTVSSFLGGMMNPSASSGSGPAVSPTVINPNPNAPQQQQPHQAAPTPTGPIQTNPDIQNLLNRPMPRLDPMPRPIPSTMYVAPSMTEQQAQMMPVPSSKPSQTISKITSDLDDRFSEVSSIASDEQTQLQQNVVIGPPKQIQPRAPSRRRSASRASSRTSRSSQSSITTKSHRNKDGTTSIRRVIDL